MVHCKGGQDTVSISAELTELRACLEDFITVDCFGFELYCPSIMQSALLNFLDFFYIDKQKAYV